MAGTAILRGQRGAGLDLDNYATWNYGRVDVPLPDRRDVVSQRKWIRASDAAALVTDLRYLAGSLEGRRTLTGLRTVARERARRANPRPRGPDQGPQCGGGVELFGRNPYTGEVVSSRWCWNRADGNVAAGSLAGLDESRPENPSSTAAEACLWRT